MIHRFIECLFMRNTVTITRDGKANNTTREYKL